MRPQHPVALISGASSGIGAATARSLAAEGYHLALGARRAAAVRTLAEELAAEHGIRTFTGALDVRSTGSVKTFVDGAVESLGAIHVIVNNAGLARGTDPMATVPEAQAALMLVAGPRRPRSAARAAARVPQATAAGSRGWPRTWLSRLPMPPLVVAR